MIYLRPTHTDPVYSMAQQLPGFWWDACGGICWHCEKPCSWVDLDFQTTLHPGRCSQAKWDKRAWRQTFELIEEMRRENQ